MNENEDRFTLNITIIKGARPVVCTLMNWKVMILKRKSNWLTGFEDMLEITLRNEQLKF